MSTKISNIFKGIFSAKIMTVLEGVVIIPLAIALFFALTSIPVASFGSMFAMMTLLMSILSVILLAISTGLFFVSKTKPRRMILIAAAVMTLSSLIVTGSNLFVASKEDVSINYRDAFGGRANIKADVEIDSYYQFDGEDIGLSLWTPKNTTEPAPIVVFIHGGGWASGDRFMKYVTGHCQYFADKGYLTVSIDYPLSTDDRHLWDKQEEIVGRAVAWVAEHAKEYGGDKDQIFLTGESAGGNLAINVATRINNGSIGEIIGQEIPSIKAIAALYPATEPTIVYYDADPLYKPTLLDLLHKHFGGSPEEYPERYYAITSMNIVDKENTPPVLLVYGNRDHYVPIQSTKQFINDMEEKEITYKTVVVPFSDHVFDMLPGCLGAQIYEQASLNWFEQFP